MNSSRIGTTSSLSIVQNSQNSKSSLKTGDTVFVRVLSAESHNRYIVSFAGQRVSVESKNPLEIGSFFRGQISTVNNKILLTPVQVQTVTDISQTSFFQQLGLPANDISLRIVQFFQSFGAKIDTDLSYKVLLFSKKFKGKEKEAAEIALYLHEKGMEINEENVLSFLYMLTGSKEYFDQNKPDSHTDEKSEKELGFLDKIYTEKVSLEDVTYGILTICNQIVTSANHWVILPLVYKLSNLEGAGCIRFLLDTKKNTTIKVCIFIDFDVVRYNFLLYCDSGDLHFCVNSSKKLDYIKLEEQLKTILNGKVSNLFYDENLVNSGFFTDDILIQQIKVDV
jgi:hypothetical protein